MAFKRASLKAIGLSDEQIESVMDLHTEVVDALKQERDSYKETADKYAEAQAELETLKKDDYKKKYDEEHTAFESFKKSVNEEKSKIAKESAVRKYFESKSITGQNLELAMRACKDEVGALEMDGEKIKDTKALDDLVAGAFKGLVSTVSTNGTPPVNPPAGGSAKKTKEEIFAIKDTAERQKAIAENHELFGF